MSERLQSFLDAVTVEVRCQEVHAEIRDELQEHVYSLQDSFIEAGQSPDQALEQALQQMGDPVEIGRRFDKVHRPRVEWGLVVLTGLLTLVGLWAAWAGDGLTLSRLRFVGIGLAVGAPLAIVDYRRLRDWGWPLFGLTWLLGAAPILLHWGQGPWSWSITSHLFLDSTPPLFALGLTGIFARWDWQRRWALLQALGLLIAPLLLYTLDARMILALTYGALWVVQIIASRPPKRAWQLFGGATVVGGALSAWTLLSTPDRLERILAWLDKDRDPMGTGYQIIREAGLWGHGPLSPAPLPQYSGVLVFSYLVHTLGWVGGLAILLLVIGFGLRLYRAAKQIREPFGASLMRLIGALLAVQGGLNLLMVTGLLPIVTIPLPFIVGDGALIYHLGLIGLALGIYRRKDLQPAPTRTPA